MGMERGKKEEEKEEGKWKRKEIDSATHPAYPPVGALPPDGSNSCSPARPDAAPDVPPTLYVGPTPDSLPRPFAAFNSAVSDQPSFAARASASSAGGRVVAPEVSVVLEVVDAEGCLEAAACGLLAAKSPPEERESAARESEVTRPVGSLRVAGVEVTCRG